MISLCFFILPFTYFYADEALESEDGDLDFEFDMEDLSDDEDKLSTKESIASKIKRRNEGCLTKFFSRTSKALR